MKTNEPYFPRQKAPLSITSVKEIKINIPDTIKWSLDGEMIVSNGPVQITNQQSAVHIFY